MKTIAVTEMRASICGEWYVKKAFSNRIYKWYYIYLKCDWIRIQRPYTNRTKAVTEILFGLNIITLMVVLCVCHSEQRCLDDGNKSKLSYYIDIKINL